MLIGEKIILRPLKIEDLEKTHEWRNNLELIKLTQGIRFPKTMEMDREWFLQALNEKNNKCIYFGIDEKLSGDFIGMIQLSNVDYISKTAVLGFVIGETERRGHGFGFEATKLIIDYSYNQINLRKLTSYIVDYNIASLNLFEKLGFSVEGNLMEHHFIDGQYRNIVIMSLIKDGN